MKLLAFSIMKIRSRFVLIACALALLIPTASAAETKSLDEIFADVSELSEDLREAVLFLTADSTIHGYGDGTYRPNRTVSQKEFLKLALVPVLKQKARTDDSLDVIVRYGQIDQIIDVAAAEDLLYQSLDSDMLDEPMTRANAVRALIAAYGVEYEDRSFRESRFVDVLPFDGELAEMVEYLAEQGIIKGRDATHFAPDDTISRAEAAKVAYRARQVFLDDMTFEEEPIEEEEEEEENTTAAIKVTSPRIRIVSITPEKVTAGDDATILFTVTNSRGRGISGLSFDSDIYVTVTKSRTEITSETEVGLGLYAVSLHIPRESAAGPICIDILLSYGRNESVSTCDPITIEQPTRSEDSQISLARLVPSSVDVGQTALIMVTPQTHNGNLVSGLDLTARIVKGSGTIIEPIVESPVGSGVYIRKVPSRPRTIR